jgi:hypothetical protein
MFVAVTMILVLGLWWWWHRGRVRAELQRHRRAAASAVVLAALLCLPVLADLVLHFPGQWASYLEFALHSERDPRTAADVVGFVGHYWTDLPWILYLLAATLGAALLATERHQLRRRAFACTYGMLVLQSVLFLYYVVRGVDHLVPIELYAYVGYFYRAVPLVLLLTVAVHAYLRLVEVGAVRSARLGPRAWVPAAALAGVIGVVATATADIGRVVPAGHTYAEGAIAVSELDARGGRLVVIDNLTGEVWATAAGLGLALSREGVDWCITGENAFRIMFGDRTCSRGERKHGLVVGLTDQQVPAGKTLVWHDEPGDPRLSAGTVQAYLRSG